MSFSHLLILGIIAVIVIPPDKLPEVARQLAKFLGEMRRMTSGIFDDLKEDMVLTPEDMKKKAQAQQENARSQTATAAPAATDSIKPDAEAVSLRTKELTPEEKKKAEDEYLKHIQGEAVAASAIEEKKKSDHE